MIKVVCDKCGADKDLVNYCVTVDLLHNHNPCSFTDTHGKPEITCDRSSIRFILCQHCYKELKLPNIYTSLRKGDVVWREDDGVDNGEKRCNNNDD